MLCSGASGDGCVGTAAGRRLLPLFHCLWQRTASARAAWIAGCCRRLHVAACRLAALLLSAPLGRLCCHFGLLLLRLLLRSFFFLSQNEEDDERVTGRQKVIVQLL